MTTFPNPTEIRMNDWPQLADRDVRQRLLVPPSRLAAVHAVVIGVGAIGRQLALQLAAVGVRRLTLFDHDTVGVENLAPQGYWPEDLGRAKVDVTARLCQRILPEIEMTPIPERFRRSSARSFANDNNVAVFAAVDDIATRQLIWEAVRSVAALFIDGRMAAEVIRIVAADRPAVDRHFRTTLFELADAYVGTCIARSTVYAASIAAGFMVAQFARWLRGLPVVPDQTLNLLAAELTVDETPKVAV